MPSVSSRLLEIGLRAMKLNQRFKTAEAFLSALKNPNYGASAKPPQSNRQFTVKTEFERSVVHLIPTQPHSSVMLMYIHGGCYTSGADTIHWNFLKELVLKTHIHVVVPLYGLAPKYDVNHGLEFIGQTYDDMRKSDPKKRVVLMGDSAGAGLALAFTQSIKPATQTLPTQLFLLSPWLDVSMENPLLKDDDAILGIAGLKASGALWAGQEGVQSPKVSPIFGTLSGLPPMHIYVGTRDMLWPDVSKFVSLAKAAGTTCFLTEEMGMLHDYMLLPIPEGKRCIEDLAQKLLAAGNDGGS